VGTGVGRREGRGVGAKVVVEGKEVAVGAGDGRIVGTRDGDEGAAVGRGEDDDMKKTKMMIILSILQFRCQLQFLTD